MPRPGRTGSSFAKGQGTGKRCCTNTRPRAAGGEEPVSAAGDAPDVHWVPGSGRPPEKEIAAHSSTPACRTPWAETPGGLQSTGLRRVRPD